MNRTVAPGIFRRTAPRAHLFNIWWQSRTYGPLGALDESGRRLYVYEVRKFCEYCQDVYQKDPNGEVDRTRFRFNICPIHPDGHFQATVNALANSKEGRLVDGEVKQQWRRVPGVSKTLSHRLELKEYSLFNERSQYPTWNDPAGNLVRTQAW
eukprot:TRINITY_DN15278_c0_g1_i1.p1 TRINITY_DN15278_c0_g1~~TRINITY_DN15278_c0_g1_i1.p1  ORF type:complete len:153 (+),score=10.74 TRINITY_DN15278_c0_g1_i1:104-562(+)